MDNPGKTRPTMLILAPLWAAAATAFATGGITLVALAMRGRSLPRPDVFVLGLTTLAALLLLSLLPPPPLPGRARTSASEYLWVILLGALGILGLFGVPWYLHWLVHFAAR